MRLRWKSAIGLAALALFVARADGSSANETIRLGVAKIANCSPIAIALAKGYFTAEGLDPKLTIFHSQAPIAVGVASGDLDFGDAAQTAALYKILPRTDGRA